MHERPGSVLTPDPKVVIDNLPRREVMGQQPPRTPTAHDIKDAVEDFPLGVLLRSSAPFGCGHVRCNQRLFVIREVGWVRFSGCHTPILPKSLTYDKVFKHPLTLLVDVSRYVVLCLHSPTALAAENLLLRKQLALYQERDVKPTRATDATRIALAWLARCFDWRRALVIVQPK